MQREKLSIEDIDAILHHEMTQRLGYDAKDHMMRVKLPRGRRGAELECEFRVGEPCASSCLERLH